MRRIVTWIGLGAAVLITLPVLAVAIALIAANIDPGRRLIERSVEQLTTGTVRIAGLSGRFPDNLQIARIDLADTDGLYARLQDMSLHWAPMRLLRGRVDVALLEAQQVRLYRLPASTSEASSSPSFPPLSLTLARLHVTRLDLGEAVFGHATSLAIEGRTEIESLAQASVALTISDLSPGAIAGTYRLDATLHPDALRAKLTVAETSRGLLATLAGLADLDGVRVDALVEGPLDRLKATLSATAGPLHGAMNGTIDAVRMTGDLAVSVTAPMMHPGPDLSWESIGLDANMHGSLVRPDATGTLVIAGFQAGMVTAQAVDATIVGNSGHIELTGRMEGTRIPGPAPDLLAASPVTIEATARLDTPGRPVRFAIRHVLATIEGSAPASPLATPLDGRVGDTSRTPPEAVSRDAPTDVGPSSGEVAFPKVAEPTAEPAAAPHPAPAIGVSGSASPAMPSSATVTVMIPDIQPLASLAGISATGRAAMTLDATRQTRATSLTARGSVGIQGGTSPLPSLIGDTGKIDLAATITDLGTLILHRLTVAGRGFQASASGAVSTDHTDLAWTLRVSDLADVQPTLTGAMDVRGQATGPLGDLTLTADLSGEVATNGQASGPVTGRLDITSLSTAPSARLTAEGSLLGAPMTLAMAVTEDAGIIRVSIDRADWKSLHADGAIALRRSAPSGPQSGPPAAQPVPLEASP